MTAPSHEAIEAASRPRGGGFNLGEGRVGQGDRALLDVKVGHVMHDGDVDVELPDGRSATVKWRFVHPLRPAPSQSDEDWAAHLEKYGRYSTKDDSGEMEAVYLRVFATIRAEATLAATKAERERIAVWAEKEFIDEPRDIAAAIRRAE